VLGVGVGPDGLGGGGGLRGGPAAAVPIAPLREQDREALAILRKNIAALGESARAQIVPGDATRPPRAMSRHTLAFLDPPYRTGLGAPALAALADAGWLAPEALAVVEIAAREELPPPPGFRLLDERVYGAARLVFLHRQETTGDTR